MTHTSCSCLTRLAHFGLGEDILSHMAFLALLRPLLSPSNPVGSGPFTVHGLSATARSPRHPCYAPFTKSFSLSAILPGCQRMA